MNKEIENITNHKRDLLLIIVSIFIGLLFSQILVFLYLYTYSYFFNPAFEIMSLLSITSNADMRIHFLIIQSLTSFIVFFLAPYMYLRRKKEFIQKILSFKEIRVYPIMILILLMLFFMIFSGTIIEWNKNFEFPELLSSFEKFAKEREIELEKLTIYLISFDNFSQYIIGVFAIAFLPGFCEEYLFRGVFQKKFNSIFKNIHLAIWLSAFLFSFFHLQFYGFFPRMLLGALFGYIYFYSNNLFYPILAHFINNFIALSIFYLSHIEFIDLSVEEINNYQTSTITSLISLAIALLFYRLLFIYFLSKKQH